MSDNKTVYLKDYQKPGFSMANTHLEFDLHEEYVIVTQQSQFQRQDGGDLILYGDDLELLRIDLDDQALSPNQYRIESSDTVSTVPQHSSNASMTTHYDMPVIASTMGQHGLVIPNCPPTFSLTIVTKIYPQKNTHLSGLYRSQDLFCTQCEAQGFRRITYFLDRPDVLTIYTTKVSADKQRYPTLLSNGNLIQTGEDKNGRHWAIWHDPFKKPSYLFALVAGTLACVKDTFKTQSGRVIDLQIFVEPGNENKCQHAMQSLKKAMRWDEEVFGREYDLDIFMIVAVSDFNMGAMENKGLNIFNAKFILASPETATDEDYIGIESVVAHEYFHNWTGNRITCRDWFQLSLKEGLTVFRDQEFSRDMNSRDVFRIRDVKALRCVQFPEDAGLMAHPVRPESYQEINNFYTATIYEKGAEVIRMQRTLLGQAGFRRGMDLYFERHDGQAVTIDDFVAAMEDANQVDFTDFKRWYSQAGTPEVMCQSRFENGELTLTFSQSCRATAECQTKQPFVIPIRMALWDSQGQCVPVETSTLIVKDATQTFHFSGFKDRPIVSLLQEFSAPIILKHAINSDDLLHLLRYETDGFAKWDAAQTLIIDALTHCYQTPRTKWHVPQGLLDAFEALFHDDTLDHALRSELLSPPSYAEVITSLQEVDVQQVEAVRDFYAEQLGCALYGAAYAEYKHLWAHEDHAIDGQAWGRRRFRNECLTLLMNADEEKALPICLRQFSKAQTMSDQMCSFNLLLNSTDDAIHQQAIDQFYQQWHHNDLVLDKWFAEQARCKRSGTLQRVEALLSHSAFQWTNPNKVRALIGAFTQANPRHFHAVDGSGYAFLTDMLIKLDKINPQIAARLATPFTRWQYLDNIRQQHIQAQLQYLSQQTLSRDLREMVDKATENG